MNKVDSFFVLIIVLLSGLAVVFKSAQYDLGDTQLLVMQNRALQNKINLLELKQKDLELSLSKPSGHREVASLQPQEAIELDPNKIAEALYNEAKLSCLKPKKENGCLEKIDSLVSQFPESKWAGKSLVVLANLYIKDKNLEQAEELQSIVQIQFKNQPEVLKDLKEFQKNLL